jgi:hypothetical protein
MSNNVGARILLVVGFVAASIAYSAWWIDRTVLDADATEKAAEQVLATSAFQDHLAEQLDEKVNDTLAEADADPRVMQAVRQALSDPRVISAFSTAVRTAHEALLRDADVDASLDVNALNAAIRDALERTAPDLAAEFARQQPLRQEIDSSELPKLQGVDDRVTSAMTLGTLVALLCITLSLLLVHDRAAMGRLGRRTAYLSVVPLLMFAIAPLLLDGRGDLPSILAAGADAYAGRVLPSAIALLVVGIAGAVTALALPKPGPDLVAPAPRPPQDDRSARYPAAPAAPPTAPPTAPIDRIGETVRS